MKGGWEVWAVWTLNDGELVLDNLGRQGRPSRVWRRASHCSVSGSLLDPEEWKDPLKVGCHGGQSKTGITRSTWQAGPPAGTEGNGRRRGCRRRQSSSMSISSSSNCHSGSEGSPTTSRQPLQERCQPRRGRSRREHHSLRRGRQVKAVPSAASLSRWVLLTADSNWCM